MVDDTKVCFILTDLQTSLMFGAGSPYLAEVQQFHQYTILVTIIFLSSAVLFYLFYTTWHKPYVQILYQYEKLCYFLIS